MKIDSEILDNMTFSYSRVNSWATGCKYGWYLQYILPELLKKSLPEDVYYFVRHNLKKEGNYFSDFGSYLHSLLDRFGKGEIDLFSILDECMAHYDENIYHAAPPNKFCNLEDTYREQAKAYFSNFDGFNDYKIISTERNVNFITNYGRKFVGFIDIELERLSDGKLVLGDHKSKKRWQSKRQMNEYFRQQYLYSIPFKEIHGKYPDYLAFNRFRAQDKDIIPFSIKGLEEAEEWVEQTIQSLYEAEDFSISAEPDDFMHTQLCNWRKICNWEQIQEHQKESEENQDEDKSD